MEGTRLRLAATPSATSAKAKRARSRWKSPNCPGFLRLPHGSAMRAAAGAPLGRGRPGPGIAGSSRLYGVGAALGRQLCPHNAAGKGRDRERGGKTRRRGAGRGRRAGRGSTSSAPPPHPAPPLPAAPARRDDALPPASPAPPPPGRSCRRHFAALSLPLSGRGGCGQRSIFKGF